ncbi:hypothetical protein [Devosia nitrariae]|uniref:Uncharacterized protein n=1 Tax=Devosia nitrariae TaxID=2071872 RepID=A0ABQ5W198_9HYPH|nr:hypothetical protein [Devosia nitrariae]GLQ53613.1 hypothetical protein GCM10010862_08720 [Devosia nitrariae]
MFHVSDLEAGLMMANNRNMAYATQQINLANAEIRRLRAELAQARADLDTERGRRQAAEYKLRRN